MTEAQPNTEIDAGADDTADLLSEFDKSSDQRPGVETPAPVQPTAESKLADVPLTFEQRLRQRMQERDQRLAEALKPQDAAPIEHYRALSERLTAVERDNAALKAEREREQQRKLDVADLEDVMAKASEAIDAFAPYLPKDYAATWIDNQISIDPELVLAWQSRYDGEAEMRNFQRKVDSALWKFGEYLRSLPDPAATEDRAIVAASVRGSGGLPPPPPPPKYNSMSDGEFAANIEKQYGIRPKL